MNINFIITFLLVCALFYYSFTAQVNRISNAYERGLEKHKLLNAKK